MFSHVMVGTNDIERSKRFYDAVLAVLGAAEAFRNTNATGTAAVVLSARRRIVLRQRTDQRRGRDVRQRWDRRLQVRVSGTGARVSRRSRSARRYVHRRSSWPT